MSTQNNCFDEVKKLEKLINYQLVNKTKDIKLIFFYKKYFNKQLKDFISIKKNKSISNDGLGESIKISIEPYSGKNYYILKIKKYLYKHYRNCMLVVLVHGSIATNEEVSFSDSDILIIFKDDLISSYKTLKKSIKLLKKIKKIILSFDPLQHHGFFALTENDLQNYPEYYLPSIILSHSRSLFPENCIDIKIKSILNMQKIKEFFENMCQGIFKQINKKEYPKNVYILKGFLSQFMLLPSLYVQVRDHKGIFKKDSFPAARKDFTEEEWSIMDEVSAIRVNWSYRISPLKKWILTRNSPWRDFLAPRIAPAIPKELQKKLSPDFYARMSILARSMQEKIK